MENMTEKQPTGHLTEEQLIEACRAVAETSTIENFVRITNLQNVSDYIGGWSRCHGLCGPIDTKGAE
jgi:hypothetical protein